MIASNTVVAMVIAAVVGWIVAIAAWFSAKNNN